MNIYYMNEKLGDTTIIVENTQPSEYQDLVDDYLAKGGKITYCEEGEAEGALRLDRFDYAMEGKMPNNSDAWSDYLNMEHMAPNIYEEHDPINKIKRVTK